MSAKLVLRVLGSEDAPRPLPTAGMLVIGSSDERAGLVLAGQGVEDAHCAIGVLKGGGWAIKDLGSRYGTVVNGKKVQSARLAAGDTVVLGSRRVRIEDPAVPVDSGESAAPAAGSPESSPPPAGASSGAASGAQAGAPEPTARKRPRPGAAALPDKIGGFRIDRLLGRGGMGTVFLAEQVSLKRPVALKVLSPKLAADTDFVRQFQTEARAAAALNHPNVVVVHDVGEADGYHYLSMEVMEKGSLEERIAAGPMPWREVLDVLHDAAGGLMFAEEKGIVHRDIKPANLMQNAAGTIKIADLGLATNVESEATTAEGRKIYGTPHFIAPEQARGEPVDNRSDLYSLGATAYRLLTGHTPFEGETTRDILRGHFTEDPRSLRSHRPEIPEGLDELVLSLLAKSPDDRPASAEVLLGRVDRLRLEADHGAGGPSLAPPKKGSRVGLLIGAAVVVLGAAGLLFSGVLGGADDPDRDAEGVAAGEPEPGLGTTPGEPAEIDDGELFAPDPGATEGGGEPGDPTDLEQLDLLAENAWLKLDTGLPKAERIAQLDDLLQRYAGTDTAARMQSERDELQAALEAEREAAQRVATQLAAAETEMRALAGLPLAEGALPHPGDQLRQLRSYNPSAELAAEPAFASAAASLEDEIVAGANRVFGARLEAADDAAARGAFDEVKANLEELLPRFDLPDYPPGTAPTGFADLRSLGDRVRARLARLDSDRAAWAAYVVSADRARVASDLRGDAGIEGALRRVDLGAAESALATLLDQLGTEDARALVEGLGRDVRDAGSALELLRETHDAGTWRRRAVLDPRGSRPTARDALDVDADGVVVERSGLGEHVPWSEFLASPEATSFLFRDRLTRELTDDERRGVLALTRTAAVLYAHGEALPILDPDVDARFSPGEAAAILAAYDLAADWLPPGNAEDARRLGREREAAALLTRALLDAEAGSWASTAAALEQLLGDFRDTLLVALLSDGGPWREAAPEAAPGEGTAPGAPPTPDGPGAGDGDPAPDGGR